ncbi:hypothetical protein [Cognataquiflexum rubidum]|uniref:hypothetical protein n=1 Tax=Cognataquiflexum rubidum TaxID=2922273 RepID=UPI001F13A456|nr:hypothetical protein [Cognataquiflexum rubidum]MCH6234210.1 hypothetical protein [Cognataquiflexum rubidum]
MKNQESGKLNYSNPEEKEARRIEEIKSLSYLEWLERLMAILETSFLLKSGSKMKNNNSAGS